MPIDTTEFAEKCKGGGFHGGLVEMNHCDYSANGYWKAPACPFDVSDLLGDEAPKAAPAPAIDTTTDQQPAAGEAWESPRNQQAAAGGAWESPREYANDYWKAPACPFDVSDLLADEAPKAAPAQAVAAPKKVAPKAAPAQAVAAPKATKSPETPPSAYGFVSAPGWQCAPLCLRAGFASTEKYASSRP